MVSENGHIPVFELRNLMRDLGFRAAEGAGRPKVPGGRRCGAAEGAGRAKVLGDIHRPPPRKGMKDRS